MHIIKQDRPQWIKTVVVVGSCAVAALLVWYASAAIREKKLNPDLTVYNELRSFTEQEMLSVRYRYEKPNSGFRCMVDFLRMLTPQQVDKIGQSGGLSFVDLNPKQRKALVGLTDIHNDNIGWYRSTDLKQSWIRIRDKRQFEWHIKKNPEDTSPGEAVYMTTLYFTEH